ncbi:GGDEF domain-containing protein [Dactylosporangium sp. CA-052675]|uniref:GGDEF domain-containing protein n=1 Tax=Dactylosporangium sp. CA-052675 TaxID=3239927 RepID=UPI003D931EE8
MVARYGGEEFALLARGLDGPELEDFAGRLHRGMAAAPDVTVSVGVACLPHDAGTIEDLARRADQALYAAKDGGRNRVVLAGSGRLVGAAASGG